jgi:hypothetical protein
MQPSNSLAELDALLEKSDLNSSDWGEYEYEDGEALLAKLNTEERAALFRSAKVRPANWRGCLVSILHPSAADEGEELVGALHDSDEDVAYEALSRTFFFCGFDDSDKKGVFEDRRRRVDAFWERVRQDRVVMLRMQHLSQASPRLTSYWCALADAAAES